MARRSQLKRQVVTPAGLIDVHEASDWLALRLTSEKRVIVTGIYSGKVQSPG